MRKKRKTEFLFSSKAIQHWESMKYSTQSIQPVSIARKHCIHGQNCLRTCLGQKIKAYKCLTDQLGEHCNMVWKKGLTQTLIVTIKRDLSRTRFYCLTLVKTLVSVLSLLIKLHLKYKRATDQYHCFLPFLMALMPYSHPPAQQERKNITRFDSVMRVRTIFQFLLAYFVLSTGSI